MSTAPSEPPRGKIVTFYSYKGGTGRSMALANVAWILANNGKKVLAIDWDLEAPGLHRYFEPFLKDSSLENSTGVIDFVLEFATAAVSPDSTEDSKDWFLPYANLIAHAVSVENEFQGGGLLDFVPAGRQDAAYATRVNSFDWQRFYDRLGGGILLEEVKRRLRARYDYVLIDSRTGVSDTSGVCTVQMPDEIVVCFTMNRQSISGAAGVAASVFNQRTKPDGTPTLKVWPVPMRIEAAEKERLENSRNRMRARFAGLMRHLSPEVEDRYWGEIEVPYEPYYSYEEILSIFADRPNQTNSVLKKMEILAGHLSGDASDSLQRLDEETRRQGLAKFTNRSAWTVLPELMLLAAEYERIRNAMEDHSNSRTYLLDTLAGRAQQLAGPKEAATVAEHLFRQARDGTRVVALAVAKNELQRSHIEMALEGISSPRSAFEQYHALRIVPSLIPTLDPTARDHIRVSIEAQLRKTIVPEPGGSRWAVAQSILTSLSKMAQPVWAASVEPISATIAGITYNLIEAKPPSPFVVYKDIDERHGPFVWTRLEHQVELPRVFRMGVHLVTNELYLGFVSHKGYETDRFWTGTRRPRSAFLTGDGKSLGPKSWPSGIAYPRGEMNQPVTGVSFAEAQAFVGWCNEVCALPAPWHWILPPEDLWEFAARSESGLTYPWGDAFDPAKCNSAESGIGHPTDVTRYADGVSRLGCHDMAGNVWEYVLGNDPQSDWCVMRGGSYKNNRFEVRSYLRLIRVPILHRPPDFGFRLAQVQNEVGN